eukprot:2164_1
MATCSHLSLVIISLLVFLIAFPTTLANECIDKSGSGTSGDANNNFTVRMRTDCANASLTIVITYDGYHMNWFGIVFAESMIGDGAANALVYTTGKTGHPQRDLALYSYILTSKAHNTSGVTYHSDDGLSPISIQTYNQSIHLVYTWELHNLTFLNHNHVPFMWARGNSSNDHRLSYHKGYGKATEPVYITLSHASDTTLTPFECGHVDMFALDICTQIMANGVVTSQMYSCDLNNAFYIDNTYDDDACNGNANISTTHPCEGDCICGSGTEQCEYALVKEYADVEANCARYYDTPLDVCIQLRNAQYSSQIVCNNGTFERITYQNGACHPASALPSDTLECEEDSDCVCSSDVQCPYALFKRVLSSQNDTCPGLEWQEETVVLNQCVRGDIDQSEVHYTCDDGDGTLSVNTCAHDQNDGNVTTPCDLQCFNTHSHREPCSGDNWTEKAYLLNECISGLNTRVSCSEDEDVLLVESCDGEGVGEAIQVCDRSCFETEKPTSATTIRPTNAPDVVTSLMSTGYDTTRLDYYGTPTSAPTDEIAMKDETWFIISITFIILFCVAALLLCYCLYLHFQDDENFWNTRGGYHKAAEDKGIEAGEVNRTASVR